MWVSVFVQTKIYVTSILVQPSHLQYATSTKKFIFSMTIALVILAGKAQPELLRVCVTMLESLLSNDTNHASTNRMHRLLCLCKEEPFRQVELACAHALAENE